MSFITSNTVNGEWWTHAYGPMNGYGDIKGPKPPKKLEKKFLATVMANSKIQAVSAVINRE